MDCAATAALPLPDSGRISPALTVPSPILVEGCDGAPGEDPGANSPKFPEQPASTAMAARAASHGQDARAGRRRQACNARNMGAESPRDDR